MYVYLCFIDYRELSLIDGLRSESRSQTPSCKALAASKVTEGARAHT